eukprot:3987468-Prymnesium_polylepis.1
MRALANLNTSSNSSPLDSKIVSTSAVCSSAGSRCLAVWLRTSTTCSELKGGHQSEGGLQGERRA